MFAQSTVDDDDDVACNGNMNDFFANSPHLTLCNRFVGKFLVPCGCDAIMLEFLLECRTTLIGGA